jgi:hypothetical protein
MYRLTVITISACAALLLAGAVYGQQQPAAPASPPPPPPAFWRANYARTGKGCDAAHGRSKKNGWNHVFAVVDGGGYLIAFEKPISLVMPLSK